MKRYFYTDPLEVAYMGKNYGMKFQADTIADVAEIYHDRWDNTYQEDCREGPVFVHPDSLHLLEPKVGDYVDAGGSGAWLVRADIADGRRLQQSVAIAKAANRRIIQRDGKPFFWPESEEA